jgi:hypothetical protein
MTYTCTGTKRSRIRVAEPTRLSRGLHDGVAEHRRGVTGIELSSVCEIRAGAAQDILIPAHVLVLRDAEEAD